MHQVIPESEMDLGNQEMDLGNQEKAVFFHVFSGIALKFVYSIFLVKKSTKLVIFLGSVTTSSKMH